MKMLEYLQITLRIPPKAPVDMQEISNNNSSWHLFFEVILHMNKIATILQFISFLKSILCCMKVHVFLLTLI